MLSFILGEVSILQPSLCNYIILIDVFRVHRPASGVDHVIKHAISSTNVDILDHQLYGQNPSTGYENTPSYHNRHATHLYGAGAGTNHPPSSASN